MIGDLNKSVVILLDKAPDEEILHRSVRICYKAHSSRALGRCLFARNAHALTLLAPVFHEEQARIAHEKKKYAPSS